MTLSIILACLWVVAACVIAMFPSRRHHWPAAYFLIAVGIPILIYVFVDSGFWAGMLALVAGVSVLRWPVRYLFRWVCRQFGRREGQGG